MEIFKNKVGRPSNEILEKRKKIKILMMLVSILIFGFIGIIIYKSFFDMMPIDGNQLNVTPSTNKFTIENLNNNCYTIYSPTTAKNWRVQVYYKKTGAWFYGDNKMIEHNHYNDYSNMQKICLTKQKNNKETYRILVKWTKGANDRTYTAEKIKNWKPDGWSYNLLTGWAYIDLKVDWGSNNNDNPPNKNINAIKYSLKATNGSLRINSEKYDAGKDISQDVIGDNYVFANSNGQTKVNVKVEFPKEIYNYVKSNAKSGEETKDLFKVVSYDKDNKVIVDSGLTRITSQYHSKEVVISNKVTSVKILVYAPGNTSMTAGDKLKEININISPIPTITTKTTGERIPNNNGDYKDSFTTYGDKSIYFTINNPNNIPVYLRWMTYPNYDTTKPGWIDDKCRKITSTDEREVKLGVTASNPKRKGIYKVFADEKSCMANSAATELTARTVWYEYKNTYMTSNDFVQIASLTGGNNNPVIVAMKNKIQTESMCYEYSLAYGSMILRNSTTFPSIWDNKVFGADVGISPKKSAYGKDLIAIIKSQIDKGIPVMIHTQHSSSQHWILVVGYKANATNEDIYKNLTTHLHVIDPYGVKENGKRIVRISSIRGGHLSNQWQHSDGRYITWSKSSKATA